ncbi:MAG TPA: GcrA family cell cycle regulator, partial [Caulobacteraceae bacterium]|nr:GcrA family cell cycle regulator [Caulobacteraceae bacterium]
MDWTAERVSALTRLWQEGLSASQVADQLGGVSRSGVLGKLHRLGL